MACEAEERTLNYFAIGAMINSTSMSLRGLHPVSSRPATLLNFQRIFRGAMGMAVAEPAPGLEMEGALHEMPHEQMDRLDEYEGKGFFYERAHAYCRLYDGTIESCVVYVDSRKTQGDWAVENLPTERYVDIIVRGMRDLGTRPQAIETLLSLPVQRRKKPTEYLRWDDGPLPAWSTERFFDEVARGRPAYVINGKVVECVGPQKGYWFERAKELAGTDATLRLAHLLYEPIYGIPSTLDAMCSNHRAFVEDFVVAAHQKIDITLQGYLQPIARIQDQGRPITVSRL